MLPADTPLFMGVFQMRRSVLCAALMSVLPVLVLTGCQDANKGAGPHRQPTPEEVLRMPVDYNINTIAVFINPNSSWIWTEDRSHVQGMLVSSLYLLGHDGKGVFGDGVIRPRLYVIESTPDGRKKQTLFKEWAFDVEDALPFRIKKPAALGWGYGLLPLDWGETDLGGRDIRVVISFERSDGRVLNHRGVSFRVPLGGGL